MSPTLPSTRHMRLSLALLVGALGCGPAASSGRPVTTEVEASCDYHDGLRLLLAPDAPSGEHCAGANVQWVGNDLQIVLVRARRGEVVPVSHPSYVHANGRRYIYIPYEHVTPGTWVEEYVDVGDGLVHTGGTRWEPSVPFPDQPGAPRIEAPR